MTEEDSPLNESEHWMNTLTPREKEVAELMSKAMTNKEIAMQLKVGIETVKEHVHNVIVKSGCRNRVAVAVAVATRQFAAA